MSDRSPEPIEELAAEGAIAAHEIEDVVRLLPPARVLWLMLPAGSVTEGTLETGSGMVESGDIVVDGANSNYRDSIRHSEKPSRVRHRVLRRRGVRWDLGLGNGFCVMVGGARSISSRAPPPPLTS